MRLMVNAGLQEKDLNAIAAAIRAGAKQVLGA
jgi:hypothetical protein